MISRKNIFSLFIFVVLFFCNHIALAALVLQIENVDYISPKPNFDEIGFESSLKIYSHFPLSGTSYYDIPDKGGAITVNVPNKPVDFLNEQYLKQLLSDILSTIRRTIVFNEGLSSEPIFFTICDKDKDEDVGIIKAEITYIDCFDEYYGSGYSCTTNIRKQTALARVTLYADHCSITAD